MATVNCRYVEQAQIADNFFRLNDDKTLSYLHLYYIITRRTINTGNHSHYKQYSAVEFSFVVSSRTRAFAHENRHIRVAQWQSVNVIKHFHTQDSFDYASKTWIHQHTTNSHKST